MTGPPVLLCRCGVWCARRIAAVVLVVATVLFVWGALAERSSARRETPPTATSTRSSSAATGSSDADGGVETHTGPTVASVAGDADGGRATVSSSETHRVLGVNVESGFTIIFGAVLSVVVAGLVAFRTDRRLLAIMMVLAGAFVVLEIAEVVHQRAEHRAALTTLAILAGLAHASAVIVAGHALTDRTARDRRGLPSSA